MGFSFLFLYDFVGCLVGLYVFFLGEEFLEFICVCELLL